jgi:hypothetical protein
MSAYRRDLHGASNQALAAAVRSAERRRCPKCGRKSALKSVNDETISGRYCRWEDCDYQDIKIRN